MDVRYDVERSDASGMRPSSEMLLRSQGQLGVVAFSRRIGMGEGIDTFNRSGNAFDVVAPVSGELDLDLSGVSCRLFSMWRLTSRSGFCALAKAGHPQSDVALILMPTEGRLQYRDRFHAHVVEAGSGLIVPFSELRELDVSSNYESVNCLLRIEPLLEKLRTFDGAPLGPALNFETVADLGTQALRSFRHTILATLDRLTRMGADATSTDALVEEILLHQLIGSWPKRSRREDLSRPASSRHVQRSLDFIEAHLTLPMTVAEVAAAAGVGVRALQFSFRKDLGRTPVQYIIDRRLERVHDELRRGEVSSISAIASRWGFVHMSDFSRRYRRKFGCTPSETQIRAGRSY